MAQTVAAFDAAFKQLYRDPIIEMLKYTSPLMDYTPRTLADDVRRLYEDKSRTMGDMCDEVNWRWPRYRGPRPVDTM